VTKVVLDVEVLVVDPHGTSGSKRNELEFLPEARDEMEPAPHLFDCLLIVDRSLEDRAGGNVHMGIAILQVEKECVRR
jgi:hypothetical protein